MFITPRVIETELDLRSAISDLRKQMFYMDELFRRSPW